MDLPPPLLSRDPERPAASPSAAAAVAGSCAKTGPRCPAGGFAILLAENDDRGSSLSSERRVLLTGFEPWADHALNPAQRLAERLDGWRAGDVRAIGLVLPVAARMANATVAAALRDLRPSAVVHLGLAAGRPALTVERGAHNYADYPMPDTAGAQPQGERLSEAGPWRHAASLDVPAVVQALRAGGAPAEASSSAGAFVCNAVLYATLEWAAAHRYDAAVGFVHLPAVSDLALADQERALDHLLRLLAAGPTPRRL
jgi:pyroglutamyl-peptidase